MKYFLIWMKKDAMLKIMTMLWIHNPVAPYFLSVSSQKQLSFLEANYNSYLKMLHRGAFAAFPKQNDKCPGAGMGTLGID